MMPTFMVVRAVRARSSDFRQPRAASWEPRQDDRIADDETFGELDSGQRAELRVAAFNELMEARRREARANRAGAGRRELRRVARQRPPLAVVDTRHVDDEGGGRGIV